MKLKPYELRLIAHCLAIASDRFSNHGCNDFDLNTEGFDLTDKEKRDLALRIALLNGDPEEISEVKNRPTPKYASDWVVMSYFADMLSGMEIPEAPPESESDEIIRLKVQLADLTQSNYKLQSRIDASKSTLMDAVRRL